MTGKLIVVKNHKSLEEAAAFVQTEIDLMDNREDIDGYTNTP